MELSREVKLLDRRWTSGEGWPLRLKSIEIHGLRGWTGQEIQFNFPIVAVVGENGTGKSTVLQCAASVYENKGGEPHYPTDFFPETRNWDQIDNAKIVYNAKVGENENVPGMLRKLKKWRGYSKRPERTVVYKDLRRLQPIAARVGYAALYRRLGANRYDDIQIEPFDQDRLTRLRNLLGRPYDGASFATVARADGKRPVPILTMGKDFSGWHQGTGEQTIHEFLKIDPPKTSLVLLDEIECSLHPRVQRKLIRDIANLCRLNDLQVILTTHSRIILEELPEAARVCVMAPPSGGRRVFYGVSPELAMTRLDEPSSSYAEVEVFVEDKRAQVMLREIISCLDADLLQTCSFVQYGPANIGRGLGLMVVENRWPRPVIVFLDGDQDRAPGCYVLPGAAAPEAAVFEGLKSKAWLDLHLRLGCAPHEVVAACEKAMFAPDEHEWLAAASRALRYDEDAMWQQMCALWARDCLRRPQAQEIVDFIKSAKLGDKPPPVLPVSVAARPTIPSESARATLPKRPRAQEPTSSGASDTPLRPRERTLFDGLETSQQ